MKICLMTLLHTRRQTEGGIRGRRILDYNHLAIATFFLTLIYLLIFLIYLYHSTTASSSGIVYL